MKIFRFLLFVLLAIFSGASFAQQPAIFWLDQTARDKIIDASGSIIQEIDSSVLSGNYSRIYGNASSVIKLAINQQDYSDRLAKLRFTLNSPSDRVLQSVEGGFTYLPNRPEGEYVLVTYDVKFWGNNNIFTEQLILKRESNSSDDSWSLASYRIAPKPTTPIL